MFKPVFVASLVLLATTPVLAQEPRDYEGISTVMIQNGSGDIDIKGTGNKISVKTNKDSFGDQCVLDTQKKLNALSIEAKKKSFFASDCKIDFSLTVPKTTNLQILNGSGNLTIKDVSSKVRFNLASGTAKINAPIYDFFGETGSGDIFINNASGTGKLQTGSGDIMINFVGTPSGRLQLESGSGDMTVIVNKGVKVHASFSSGSGQLKSAIPNTPGASLLIDASSGSGDLTILHNPN